MAESRAPRTGHDARLTRRSLSVMFPDNTKLRRLLPRLQTKRKLSLPSREQRPRTMVSICSRAVVRSVRLV